MGEAPSPSREEILAELSTILEEGARGVPGVSATISSSKGVLWQSTAGFSDVLKLEPIHEEHIFGIGSITKVFVTVVIMQLVDEGRLKLTDTLDMFLDDELVLGVGNAATATVDLLLRHRAGVESWEDDPVWIVEGRGKKMDPTRMWGKTDALEYIQRSSSLEVGKFSYSNTGFTLLGLLIEGITGETAESEIRSRIVTPLGLNHTFLEGFEDKCSGELPHRYHFDTKPFREKAGIHPSFPTLYHGNIHLIDASTSNLSVEWTAGGIVSSPSDITAFSLALRDGKLLSPSSMVALKDWKEARPDLEFGHGLARFHVKNGSGWWLGHNGSALGFTGVMFWAEEGDCAVSVLSNVGTMHCGVIPNDASKLVMDTKLLILAKELAALTT